MKKQYKIKPEYYDNWGAYEGADVIDIDEIKRLADEWETTVEALLEQVDEI